MAWTLFLGSVTCLPASLVMSVMISIVAGGSVAPEFSCGWKPLPLDDVLALLATILLGAVDIYILTLFRWRSNFHVVKIEALYRSSREMGSCIP